MTSKPTLDDLFDRFLDAACREKSASTVRRYRRVFEHLQNFLDIVDAAPLLGTDPAELLEVERGFGHRGAFARVFDATDFVCCLPAFIDEPWLMTTPADARAQVSLMGRLLVWFERHNCISMWNGACALYEAEAQVRRARLGLCKSAEPRSARAVNP